MPEQRSRSLEERRTYYDHEPAYRRLKQSGKSGWLSCGQSAPVARYLRMFACTGYLPRPPARVLDFGCGGGELALMLARKGHDVTGIDYSKTAIELARRNAEVAGLEGLRFHRRDALSPRLRSSHYDAVFSIMVLHCLIDDDRKTYLSNARGALKGSGVLALTSMVDLPKSREVRSRLRIDRRTRIDRQRTRCYASEKRILGEVVAAGLEVLYRARWVDPSDDQGSDDLLVLARKA